MKHPVMRLIALASMVLLAALLGSCAFDTAGKSESRNTAESIAASSDSAPIRTELTCRVVHRDNDTLLLAAENGTADEVYTLPLADLPDESQSFTSIGAGDLVVVTFNGGVETAFPAQFLQIERVSLVRGGVDDLCVLYLQVLEDLWTTDSGLNGDIAMVGVDLSQTSLWPSEQAAVAWLFAQNHELQLVTGDIGTLKEQGYLTPDDPANPNTLYHWADGCLFSITEQPLDGIYHGLRPLRFEAMKWRSGTGAYWFADCTSVQSALGHWADYNVGNCAIS